MRDYSNNIRVIKDKIYNLGTGYKTKRDAESAAKKRRKQGYLVRVVHLMAGWYLYEHWNKGRR